MAGDTTKLIIELELILRNLNRTLQGLDQVQKKLQSITQIKPGRPQSQSQNQAVTTATRLANAQQKLQNQQQRLQNQQQRLAIQTQNVTTAQGRAGLAAQRLAAAQQRLATATGAAGRSTLNLDQILGRVGGSLRNLGLGLTSLGASLTVALSAPLTALGVLATRNAVTLDSLNRGLVAITGSADEAGVQLARLTNIAKLPGIGFQEAIQGSIRLQAVGFSAEKAEKALIEFSNAVALTGGGRDELDRITVQLGQLSAKGKVLSQDLKPIIEAGPAVGRALKEAFGTVNAQDIQELGLSTDEFLDKLVAQLGKLPRAAAGFRNTFDNFADSVFRASSAIGEAIIPVLTRLIDFLEPAITTLAAGFKQLPAGIQTTVVVLGSLLAVLGPALFVVGQFATGIGGLISAFGRLFALMQTALPVVTGLTGALTAQQAALGGLAISAGGLIAAITAVAAVIGVLVLLSRRQKDAIQITREQIAANEAQINSLKNQLKFTDGLAKGVARTADEQKRLNDIYFSLNTQARVRVAGITDEEKRLAQLREELQRLLNLRNEERVQQAANLAATLADTTAQIKSTEDQRDAITRRIAANTELAEAIRRTGGAGQEFNRILAQQNLTGQSAEQVIAQLGKANEQLLRVQDEAVKSGEKLNGTAEEQGQILRRLQQQTGLSTRELLTAAKAMGVFQGDVESTLPALERFIALEESAAESVDALTKAIAEQSKELLKAGDEADAAEKRRKSLIEAAVSLSKEASTSFDGALKFMRAFIAAQPELAAAIQKELQLQQKSMDEFLNDLFRKGGGRGESSLRNAQQQLANQRLQVIEATADKEAAIAKQKNDRLILGNELLLKRQLISYRSYLEAKDALTKQNLDLEINAQLLIAKNARGAQFRLLAAAQKAGIPAAERVRREAQAAVQQEKALQAETKLTELETEREKATNELRQALAESDVEQLRDIRQLQIEYGQLTGRIEDALNAATDEKFRESLKQLALAQDFLNRKILEARESGSREREAELEAESRLNQTQIEAINNIVTQERATNQLAAAQELVRQAKEKQAALEESLAFEVEFRGLKEEEAIRRRLEGEQRLADSLRVVRDLVQATVDGLTERGLKPPQQLLDFIRELKGELQGLGELPFGEQFRLVEKEFSRLNDERLVKIANIERAIRERDIAEAEGLLLIRRINGQYSADLEQQVALLKQIATASNDANLQRQAQAAEQTAKDANSQLAGLDRQLRSVSIDALKDSFIDFFRSLRDNTISAQEKLLNFVDSIVARISDVIAENLGQQLIESLFGTPKDGGGGIIAGIKKLFGFGGGESSKAIVPDVAGKATAATFTASVTTAATTFAAIVTTAATAVAAALDSAAAISSASGGLGAALGAATGLFPAVPGGLYKVVEGGYPEAVLTTDPKYAARQFQILKAFIAETRGLGGRIRGFAEGGMFSARQLQAGLVNGMSLPPVSVNANFADVSVAGSGSSSTTWRQILVDKRSAADWINTPEGERAVWTVLEKDRPKLRKLGGN